MRMIYFLLLFIFSFAEILAQSNAYCVVFLVNARQLDYTNTSSLLKTIAKHPSDGSKNGDVGHAWVYVEGILNGKRVFIEGGHSGERGISQPKYFDGIMNLVDVGDPNPVRYLWNVQKDGYFEKGCGGHFPTYAAMRMITEEQFLSILQFIEQYAFENYELSKKQCCTFVTGVAAAAGIPLSAKMSIRLDQEICLSGGRLHLWTHPIYEMFHFATPDKLEMELRQLVEEGVLVNASLWAAQRYRLSWGQKIVNAWTNLVRFPERCVRANLFR